MTILCVLVGHKISMKVEKQFLQGSYNPLGLPLSLHVTEALMSTKAETAVLW